MFRHRVVIVPRPYIHHHHHRCRIAGDGRRVVAPPCPRSTARLQRSPVGRVESFRSWWSWDYLVGLVGVEFNAPLDTI